MQIYPKRQRAISGPKGQSKKVAEIKWCGLRGHTNTTHPNTKANAASTPAVKAKAEAKKANNNCNWQEHSSERQPFCIPKMSKQMYNQIITMVWHWTNIWTGCQRSTKQQPPSACNTKLTFKSVFSWDKNKHVNTVYTCCTTVPCLRVSENTE